MNYLLSLKSGIACYDVRLVNNWIKAHGGKIGRDFQTRREQLQAFVDEQHTVQGLPLVKVMDWEIEDGSTS